VQTQNPWPLLRGWTPGPFSLDGPLLERQQIFFRSGSPEPPFEKAALRIPFPLVLALFLTSPHSILLLLLLVLKLDLGLKGVSIWVLVKVCGSSQLLLLGEGSSGDVQVLLGLCK